MNKVGTAALERVTYSNIKADFGGVHALFDTLIPQARTTLLGRDVPHRIAGKSAYGPRPYDAACPIDRRLILGRFTCADDILVAQAVEAARAAFPAWSRTDWATRVVMMRAFADALESRKYDLATACLLEVGKSRMEAMGEAEEAIDLVRYYCDEMQSNEGFIRPLKRAFDNEETLDRLRPIGVFGVIAPFNFPLALSVNMMSAALIAGNTVVYKPSQFAGLTGALIVEAAEAAALPPGTINLLTGDGATGQAMVDHPGFSGFAFTGSYQVGTALIRTIAAGQHNRPAIVEMGGKNPTYVTASADLEAAAQGVMRSAFGLQGQKCSAGSKVYVHEDIRDAFIARLLELTAEIVVGDPANRDVFMGPLIGENALRRFLTARDAARVDGTILAGGEQLAGGLFDHGFYVTPTIVEGLAADHWINKDELFLPFLSVLIFSDLKAAIADGNDIAYGLTAGCYATDRAELEIFFDQAEAGVLYANRASGATTGAWPGIQSFCGWKGSGAGTKGGLGPYYLQQFMREQSLTVWQG